MSAKFAALGALALALLTPPAGAQPGPPPQLTPPAINGRMSDAEIRAGLDSWLSGMSQQGDFNGAVLVARDGREVYARTFGITDLQGRTALSLDTHFPIASIGKAFTHVAIGQLIQSSRLSPTATIGDLIPDYPDNVSRNATVDQLLNMRGGVGDIFGPAFRDADKARFQSNTDYFRFVSSQPPQFAPGEREAYCNGCYVVLGEIIARVSGQRYEDYVAEHVFAPAGMTNSGFFHRDQLPGNTTRFIGRPGGPGTELRDVSEFHGMSGSAAGNVYSTLRDMLAFDNALREHRLLNPELTGQVLHGDPQTGRATNRVGFAGGAPGVNTMLYGNGAWTVVVLTNREPPLGEAIGSTVFPLLAGPRPQ